LRKFIVEMCSCLINLNKIGIVHMDIKPDNILLNWNNNGSSFSDIKLIDFGSAFYYEEKGSI